MKFNQAAPNVPTERIFYLFTSSTDQMFLWNIKLHFKLKNIYNSNATGLQIFAITQQTLSTFYQTLLMLQHYL